MILDAFALPLFQRAVVASLLVSVLCGAIGAFVVTKRLSSLAGGLSHAAFGGVGLAFLFGWEPLLGAVLFCVLGAVALALVYRRRRESLETLIALFWSAGMALGVICLSLVPGYAPDLSTYLFGSLLFVPDAYLWATAIVTLVTLLIITRFFLELRAIAFDEEFSEVAGLPVETLFIVLLTMIAVTTVLLLQVTGAILTIALLTTPTVIALQWCRSLVHTMIVAGLIAVASNMSGLIGSYWLSVDYAWEVPTGPVIIMLLTGLYAASSGVRAILSSNEME